MLEVGKMSFSNFNDFQNKPSSYVQGTSGGGTSTGAGVDAGGGNGGTNNTANQSSPPGLFGSSPNSFTEQGGMTSYYQFANPWQQPLPSQNLQHLSQKLQSNLQAPHQQVPPQQQRRPSSLDSMSIWGHNIGGSGSISGSVGASGGAGAGGNNSIWSTQHRGSTGSSIGEFIPASHSQQQQQQQQGGFFEQRKSYDESSQIFDLNFRMQNYVEDMQNQQYPLQQGQQQYSNISPRFQNVMPFEAQQQTQQPLLDKLSQLQTFQTQSQPVPLTEANLNSIHDYFLSDSHERVRVTLKLLQERFVEEQKYLNDTYQLPNFPVENSLRNYQLVLVGFKAGRIDVFYLPMNQNEFWIKDLKIGDLVIVEADRGRDLGKIFKLNVSIDEARLMKLLQFQEQQAALSDLDLQIDSILSIRNFHQHSNPPTLHFPKPIVGVALKKEVSQILNKKQDEEKACRLCLAKISNTTTIGQKDLLQMKLIDAEYQFDRKKLIFYYSTSKRIDFRDLVRELFRIYKTRIWMCAVIGLPYVPGEINSQQQKELFYQSNQGQSQQQQHQQPTQSLPHQNSTTYNYDGGNNKVFSQPFNQFQYFEPNQLKDPFRYQGQYFQPQSPFVRRTSILFDRRLSDPSESEDGTNVSDGTINVTRNGSIGMVHGGDIPRKFKGYESSKEIERNVEDVDDLSGAESSFVLQSLVDSIDH